MSNWESLGKAIVEATAIKAQVDAIEAEISILKTQKVSNEAEIQKRINLEKINEGLDCDIAKLTSDKDSLLVEFDKRNAKLKAANVQLPDKPPSGEFIRVG